MILKFKTVKEWEKIGFLSDIPEERKQMVADCFNTASKWLIEGSIVTSEKQGELETLVFPLFYRIAKVVDLTEAQVLETCKEFRQAWVDFDPSQLINVEYLADPELHFVKSFAEMKINQLKQK